MKKRILLIDDDADDRAMFCEAFRDVAPAFSCDTAVNGRTALNQLKEGAIGQPDLIFLDVNMPIMNGWQCLAVLKSTPEYKNIPVIIYSTSSYPEDMEKARQSGALCFFTKPANFENLKARLRDVTLHLLSNTLSSLTRASHFIDDDR